MEDDYSRLKIEQRTEGMIDVTEYLVTLSEARAILKYLAWLRSGEFGTFEGKKYRNPDGNHLDVTISNRERTSLINVLFEDNEQNYI